MKTWWPIEEWWGKRPGFLPSAPTVVKPSTPPRPVDRSATCRTCGKPAAVRGRTAGYCGATCKAAA